jgi:hypothetical protein
MKNLLLLVFLTIGPVAFADENLLKNSDFTDGAAHWEGDCHSASSNDAPPSFSNTSSAPASGATVELRGHDWTTVTQDFDGKVGDFVLEVTYSLSPDLKFSTDPADYQNVTGAAGMSRFKALQGTMGQWIILLSDLGARRNHYWPIAPQGNSPTQSLKANVHLTTGDDAAKTLCLLFPPGTGTVTLTHVALIGQ